VLDAMLPFLREGYGNPSSLHGAGQAARHAIDDAREEIAATFGCRPKDVVFTSGGTESDNLALKSAWLARKPGTKRIVISSVEHPAVADTARALAAQGAELVELPVDGDGNMVCAEVERAITAETAVVSVMWANNETGVLFPIERVGTLCRERGVLFHVDAVQTAGKIAIDLSRLPVDLLSVSAHKVYGPKGVGALLVRKDTPFHTVQTGGHQERGRRGGTENVAGIVGFGAALKLARQLQSTGPQQLNALVEHFEQGLIARIPDVRIAGASSPRVAGTTNALFQNVEGEALLMALDLAGICASSGSACTSGSLEPSHVVKAMGFSNDWARGAVRFSFGRGNTIAEIDQTLDVLARVVPRLRSSPAPHPRQ